jgi:hypothetical protein
LRALFLEVDLALPLDPVLLPGPKVISDPPDEFGEVVPPSRSSRDHERRYPGANSRGSDVSEMSARVGKATAHCEE